MIGDDPDATAAVAIGLGRLQALRRHVALGDLIDAAPLRALVPGDDPHGISDVFMFGVSVNRIARQADASGNLHVLPSGSESPLQEEILSSDRWRRLAGGFREMGALLLVAAPAGAPGLDALASMMDGVVLVGGVPSPPDGTRVLAHVAEPVRPRAAREARPAVAAAAAKRRSRAVPLALLLLALLGVIGWWQREPLRRFVDARLGAAAGPGAAAGDPAAPPTPAPPSAPVGDPAAAPADSATVDSALATDTAIAPVIANPGDSALASTWAVQMVSMNTIDGAMLRVLDATALVPSPTFSPVTVGAERTLWYRVIAGAWPRRGPADSLLRVLRTRGVLAAGAGIVVRTPLALRLTSGATRTSAPALVEAYRAKGIPAYPLLLNDGTVTIYAGAFGNAADAERLASLLRTNNIEATLVYRVGRVF